MKGALVFALLLAVALLSLALVMPPVQALLQLRRRRRLEDTATSRIRSAAQGWVELAGRLVTEDGVPLVAPLRPVPCLWWRYRIWAPGGNGPRVVDQGESRGAWALDDGTGRCLLDPGDAGLIPSREVDWPRFRGQHRRRRWRGPLPPGHTAVQLPKLPALPPWLHRLVEPVFAQPCSYELEWLPFGLRAHAQGWFRTRHGTGTGAAAVHLLTHEPGGRALRVELASEPELLRSPWPSARRLTWTAASLLMAGGLLWLLLWGPAR